MNNSIKSLDLKNSSIFILIKQAFITDKSSTSFFNDNFQIQVKNI